jgi:hypothetical protein
MEFDNVEAMKSVVAVGLNIWLGHSLRHSALARPRAVTGAPLVLSSKQQQPVLEPLGRATNLTAARKDRKTTAQARASSSFWLDLRW